MPALPFYSSSVNTETYDLTVGRVIKDDADVRFYRDLALGSGSHVLELACGTGRVTIPLAQVGLNVTGLDRSPGMLREARAKLAALGQTIAGRIRLIEGDMVDLSLDTVFDTVLMPATAFAFLLAPEAQRACLSRVFEHLRPGGVLSIAVFDPRLDLCVPGDLGGRADTALDPRSGHTVRVEVRSRHNDTLAQVLHEAWRFTELDADAGVLRSADEELVLRWTYRYEMRHLLELAGFDRIEEFSDFYGTPPAYGVQQVWVCRRPRGGCPLIHRTYVLMQSQDIYAADYPCWWAVEKSQNCVLADRNWWIRPFLPTGAGDTFCLARRGQRDRHQASGSGGNGANDLFESSWTRNGSRDGRRTYTAETGM